MGWGEGGGGGRLGARSDFRIEAVPTIYEHVEDFFLKFIRPAISFLMVEGLTTFLRVDSFSF